MMNMEPEKSFTDEENNNEKQKNVEEINKINKNP